MVCSFIAAEVEKDSRPRKREKLNALPAETLSELAKTGALELTYAHLLSMNNLSLVADRVAKRSADLATVGAAEG